VTPPTITAGVRVYNGERHIAETLDAILAQSHPADEVLVVDDGSTDGTSEVLEGYAGRVRVVRQANGGLAAAFNRVFEEARCEYVAICDADDVWMPSKLERQAAALEAQPEIDVAFAAASIFGDAEGLCRYRAREPGIVDAARFKSDLFAVNKVCPSATVVRRDLFCALGPFVELDGVEDFEWFLRAACADAVFFYDPVIVVGYRRHPGQVTERMLRVQSGLYRVRMMHADEIPDRTAVRTTFGVNLFKIGRLLVDEGQPRDARRAFLGSLRHVRVPTLSTQARALVWATVLTLPDGARDSSGDSLVRVSRWFDGARGGRPAELP